MNLVQKSRNFLNLIDKYPITCFEVSSQVCQKIWILNQRKQVFGFKKINL